MSGIDEMDVDAQFLGIVNATVNSRFARVVLTELIEGVKVSIVEPCLEEPEGIRRGYLWQAVTGNFRLTNCYTNDGRQVPGAAIGGRMIATSTHSAQRCLDNVRRVLAAEAAESRKG